MIKKVLLVSFDVFPDVYPGALRTINLAKAFCDAGYECKIGAAEIRLNNKYMPTGFKLSISRNDIYSVSEYLGYKGSKYKRAIRNLILGGIRLSKWTEKEISKGNVGAVIVSAKNSFLPSILRGRLRKSSVPLIFDVVEWPEPNQYLLGTFGPWHLQGEYNFRHVFPKANGVITISSYLYEHFRELNENVIKIPPLIDIKDEKWNMDISNCESKELTQFVFFGNIGRKDDIIMPIIAIDILSRKKEKIKLKIIGSDQYGIIKKFLSDNRYKKNIEYIGILPHNKTIENLLCSEYSIIFRPDRRYSRAGFPTKFVESLAAGVPVISNITSDIGDYLVDKENGFVIPEYSLRALCIKLEESCTVDFYSRIRMKHNAKKTAEYKFDYRNYIDTVKSFLSKYL